MVRCCPFALVVGLTFVSGLPAHAADNPCRSGPVNAALIPTTNIPGVVALHFRGAQGAQVSFYECVDGASVLLGRHTDDPNAVTELSPATWWRCDRLVRRFAATATLPDGTPARGTTAIRTMSCVHRFALTVPGRVARGASARIRIFDRWDQGGIRTKLCIDPPRGAVRCRHVALPVGVNVVRRSIRLSQRGDWRITVKAPRARLAATIAVGAHAASHRSLLPTVLATGDSTMLGTESFLADDLDGRANVDSDVHPGTSISATNEWSHVSPRQVRTDHQQLTVLSIGASEGYEMQTPAGDRRTCCDDDWIDEWRRRLELSLHDYLRHGKGRVLLLTQPIQKDPDRGPITAAVNVALLRAAAELDGVEVLRLDQVFTPHGYRASMTYRGRRVRVRLYDGIHLSVAGTSIAARLVAKRLKRLGWLR